MKTPKTIDGVDVLDLEEYPWHASAVWDVQAFRVEFSPPGEWVVLFEMPGPSGSCKCVCKIEECYSSLAAKNQDLGP